jgi:MFS family permease
MSTAIDDVLPESAQWRNSLVFMLNTSLAYLVAPVFYVGVLHAAILESFEASDTVANLPEAAYLWVMPLPVLLAWLLPSPRLLKPMLAASLGVMGTAGFVVAALFAVAPRSWVVPALVVHAAAIGVTNGVRQMCLWELVGRGLSAERRGRMLGWTFGLSPAFAVLGSCASQLVLSGNFLDVIRVPPVPAPWNYVVLFGVTAPAMWLSAALVSIARVPIGPEAHERVTIADVRLGLGQFCLNPLIVIAVVGFLLTYGGTMIMNNLSLYARETIGESAEKYAGLQLALRFGFKCLAGFALGWLVTKVHAKASLLATTVTCLAGVAWALVVPGKWYLLSFGLLGAGELFYVYYLNYIVGCSAPDRMRENTAYTNLIGTAVGFVPLLFGFVSDRYGLRSSFGGAIVILAAAMLIVGAGLPRQPHVRDQTTP